jgi:hypothetical protein
MYFSSYVKKLQQRAPRGREVKRKKGDYTKN